MLVVARVAAHLDFHAPLIASRRAPRWQNQFAHLDAHVANHFRELPGLGDLRPVEQVPNESQRSPKADPAWRHALFRGYRLHLVAHQVVSGRQSPDLLRHPLWRFRSDSFLPLQRVGLDFVVTQLQSPIPQLADRLIREFPLVLHAARTVLYDPSCRN